MRGHPETLWICIAKTKRSEGRPQHKYTEQILKDVVGMNTENSRTISIKMESYVKPVLRVQLQHQLLVDISRITEDVDRLNVRTIFLCFYVIFFLSQHFNNIIS